jgi:hypothetical protein
MKLINKVNKYLKKIGFTTEIDVYEGDRTYINIYKSVINKAREIEIGAIEFNCEGTIITDVRFCRGDEYDYHPAFYLTDIVKTKDVKITLEKNVN